VLEDGETRHQPRRQRWMPRLVRVSLSELPLQERPVDRLGELHQSVLAIDDLIEPRAKQILLARIPPFFRLHAIPSTQSAQAKEITASDSMESQNRICKKTAGQTQKSGKSKYISAPLQYVRSTPYKFFTDDQSMKRNNGGCSDQPNEVVHDVVLPIVQRQSGNVG
jgi:hypothetical protein